MHHFAFFLNWTNGERHTCTSDFSLFLFSDTLYRDDVLRLVRENQSRTHTQIAKRIRNHLSSTYPGSSWVVTVYDDVTGFNKHAVLGYNYFHRFRYYGVNIDVTRFPHYGLRSPSPTILTIVGSITVSNAETAVYTIRDRFNTNNETFTTIHAVRKSSLNDQGLVTASYIADSNYFWREFSNVIVIVVAPRYF